VLLLQLKGFGKRECLAKKSLSLAEMGGVNFRSRFCLSFFIQIPPRQTKKRLKKQKSTWGQLMYYTHNLCFY
jgi:hypothetical protein